MLCQIEFNNPGVGGDTSWEKRGQRREGIYEAKGVDNGEGDVQKW